MNDKSPEINWEITPLEKRKRTKRFILVTWLSFIGLLISSLFYFGSDFTSWALRGGIKFALNRVFYIVIGAIGSILFFFLLNFILPYKKRTYFLDNEKLVISKGKKKKYFLWNEFDCFYLHRFYRGSSNKQDPTAKKILKAKQTIEGQIFYLRKKSTNFFARFYKVLVVIYSEPDNAKSVLNLLARHLPKKTMKSTSDLGLVFYQFK